MKRKEADHGSAQRFKPEREGSETMKVRSITALAAIAALGMIPATAQADTPTLVSPANGAVIPYTGHTPIFQVACDNGDGTGDCTSPEISVARSVNALNNGNYVADGNLTGDGAGQSATAGLWGDWSDSAMPYLPGTYYWEVTSDDAGDTSAISSFTVATPPPTCVWNWRKRKHHHRARVQTCTAWKAPKPLPPPPPPPGPGQPGYVPNDADASSAASDAVNGRWWAGSQLSYAECHPQYSGPGWQCSVYGQYSDVLQESPWVAFVDVTYTNGNYQVGQPY
jgi:hypothetical protein